MVDRFQQYGPDSTCVERAKLNQAIEPYQPIEVPAKPGAKPHSRVKELLALPVGEHHQDEVANFGPIVQHQQQLQHNISRNPVYPKQNDC